MTDWYTANDWTNYRLPSEDEDIQAAEVRISTILTELVSMLAEVYLTENLGAGREAFVTATNRLYDHIGHAFETKADLQTAVLVLLAPFATRHAERVTADHQMPDELPPEWMT